MRSGSQGRSVAAACVIATHLEKPCSFFKIASEDGSSARSSGVRQFPEAAASSSAPMLSESASILSRATLCSTAVVVYYLKFHATVQNMFFITDK